MKTEKRQEEKEKPTLSFLIPLKDEEESLEELYAGITEQAVAHSRSWEILFIDDGSTDRSWEKIQRMVTRDPAHVRGIRFRTNIGKAGALAAGYEAAKNEIVFTLDADLQDDPQEIPRFLEKMEEGHDIVSGWKRKRFDPWHKVLPSRVFNWMLSRLNGVHLHDHNCGFKCYRRAVVQTLPMYGEMHRMVPSLASIEGFRTAEIPVTHHARQFGVSKYGVKRFLRGFCDMWTVYFLKNYRERPLHLFGGAAATVFVAGGLLWVISFTGGLPAALAMSFAVSGPVLVAAAVMLVMMGFTAELSVNRQFSENRPLPVLEKIGMEQQGLPVEKAGFFDAVQRQIENPPVAKSGGKPRAVVADDDKIMRSILAGCLRQGGWEVNEAENCDGALKAIRPETDVAFLDVYMPGGNGLSLIPDVLRRGRDIKVVMVSSEDSISAGVQAMKNGAFEYLCKPCNPGEVLSTARRAVNARTGEVERKLQAA